MSFETEISWLGTGWSRGKRTYAKPYVECATGLAVDWITQTGIPSTAGKKVLQVAMAGSSCNTSGTCGDSEQVQLHLPIRAVKHRKLGAFQDKIPPTVVHEFMHSLRYERYPAQQASLAEYAASEGIAYVAESLFESALLGDRATHVMSYIPELHDEQYQALVDQLVLSGAGFAPMAYLDESYIDQWFSPVDARVYTTYLEVVGVNAVMNLVAAGASMNELIDLPAEEILGQAA
jgi:hypothetical protein